MTALDLLNHLLNFMAPAFFVALLLAACGRFLLPKTPLAPALWAQFAINFMVGVAVLAAGLVLLGRDGMMATYGVLVAVCGTVQWGLLRGWRP
ncbi:MAG: hypothetical protein JWQ03_2402 [Variovorax sp.]|nr:hypothetical protein [Variovorax sp.]